MKDGTTNGGEATQQVALPAGLLARAYQAAYARWIAHAKGAAAHKDPITLALASAAQVGWIAIGPRAFLGHNGEGITCVMAHQSC